MKINPNLQEIAREAIGWRKLLHANPGIAYDEAFAGRLIGEKLKEFGYKDSQISAGWGKNPGWKPELMGAGGYGYVLTIEGNNGSGKTIGLRFDTDALPIKEETNLDWRSKIDGVMHACGHDGHTAIGLAVAKHFAVAANRDFSGTLKIIFQPAEEAAKGALAMLHEGLLKEHPMNAVFALHNWPGLPFGQVAVHPGPVMASSTYFNIKVQGVGAHVAKFDEAENPIGLAAKMIAQLPQSTREGAYSTWHSTELTHMSAGSSQGRGAIPSTALLQGSIRTFSPEVLEGIKGRIKALAEKFNSEVTFMDGSPATINNPEQAEIIRAVAENVHGEENVQWDIPPELTAEDFGFVLKEVPGAYIWMGQGDPSKPETQKPLHNPGYGFNDDLIAPAAQTFIELVHHRLG